MIRFTSLPAIPANYPGLDVLTQSEVGLARADGYVEDESNVSESVNRAGVDFSFQPLTPGDLGNWRTKVYLVWFCFVYENLSTMRKPMGAMEELVSEFKAPDILDIGDIRLGSLYAGAGAADPLASCDLQKEIVRLKPHYTRAVELFRSIR